MNENNLGHAFALMGSLKYERMVDPGWIKARDRIAAFIRDRGSSGVTYRELAQGCRAFKNLQGKKIKARMLDSLADSGAVERTFMRLGGWDVTHLTAI